MSEIHVNSPSGKTMRNSKQRQAILETLTKQQSHMSAEEIYQTVKMLQPTISLGTVYRNLEVLSETGKTYRTSFADGKARYELAVKGHHHHLVLSLIHISEPTRRTPISYAVFCLKKKKRDS